MAENYLNRFAACTAGGFLCHQYEKSKKNAYKLGCIEVQKKDDKALFSVCFIKRFGKKCYPNFGFRNAMWKIA